MTGPKPRRLTSRRKNVGVGLLGLGELRVDPELQQRAAIDPDTVRDYADAIRAGVQLPALVAFEDSEDPGRGCWLADGFHRQLAYREAGVLEVLVDLRRGTRRDALRHSIGANDSHGLRRTRADKRRAVTTALADAEWSALSDRELAGMTGTSHTFVGIVRRELAEPEAGNVATAPTAPELPLLANPPTAALLPRQCDAVWTDGSRCVWRLGHPGNHTAPDEQDQLQSWEGDAPPAEAEEPDLYPTREPPAGEWTAAPLDQALSDRIDEALKPPPATDAQVELFARQLRSLWIPGAGPEGAPIALTRLRREALPDGAPGDLFERALELGAGLGWWRVAGDCLLEAAAPAPTCGLLHPVYETPCTQVAGHTTPHYARVDANGVRGASWRNDPPAPPPEPVTVRLAGPTATLDSGLVCDSKHPKWAMNCPKPIGHEGPCGGLVSFGETITWEQPDLAAAPAPSAPRPVDPDSWSTPDGIIERVKAVFGGSIDLDPATNEAAQQRIGALDHYTAARDGLTVPWYGQVWLNPPYSHPLVEQFTSKLLAEIDAGNVTEALLLVNAATSAKWQQALFRPGNVFCLVRGRIEFVDEDNEPGTSPRHSQLILYFGPRPAAFREAFGDLGTIVTVTG
jgi:hypothetical protein